MIKINKEITISVREDECSADAIGRYMKRNKCKIYKEKRFADIVFEGWENEEYGSIWISQMDYNATTEKVKFILAGNLY